MLTFFSFFLPQDEENGDNPKANLYNRISKLKISMKEDIDKRLEQFFLSENSFP